MRAAALPAVMSHLQPEVSNSSFSLVSDFSFFGEYLSKAE